MEGTALGTRLLKCFWYFGKGANELKAQTDRAYPGFLSMKRAKEFCYLLLDGMLVHRRVTL